MEETIIERYCRERREHLEKHKWYLSEKHGSDVGEDRATVDFEMHHDRRVHDEILEKLEREGYTPYGTPKGILPHP